jgi:hypothetical protein
MKIPPTLLKTPGLYEKTSISMKNHPSSLLKNLHLYEKPSSLVAPRGRRYTESRQDRA